MRALAIRTMTNIQVKGGLEATCASLKSALKDKDAYVAKTAAIAVGKVYAYNDAFCVEEGLLDGLKALLLHDNSMVVANAVGVLVEIARKSGQFEFALDVATTNKLLTACDEASEWSQAFILESVMNYIPENASAAELVAERVLPRLQHSNSAIILACVRIILHLVNFMDKRETVALFVKKLGPPLGTLKAEI